MDVVELKAAARRTWAAGDYDSMVERIWGVGADLVERVGVAEDDSVLDVACGTGNASIPAALAGAKVTGLDITPELLEGAARRAADAGVEIEWIEGDAEELPFEDESFDVVLSTFGSMFAPRHEVAAAEIVRVLRPGGQFAVTAWTPDGSVGDFFRTVSRFAPEPPPGFQPPPLWGERDHVERIFAGKGIELRFEDAAVAFQYDSVEAAVDEFWEKFGPIVTLRRKLEAEGREQELREALVANFEDHRSEGGGVAYDGEYLITLGRKTA
jgi:SAM-dependent methyltransferase